MIVHKGPFVRNAYLAYSWVVFSVDAPIVEFDGETMIMIDFERQMNTLTTHTDDINLQFKTESLYGPLFEAVSTAEKQYFRVELENGLIKIRTNINRASQPPRDAVC